MLIAIDFDGVISEYRGWRGIGVFGPVINGAKEAIETLKKNGHEILINTCRKEISLVESYLGRHQILYDYINESPKNNELNLSPAKQCADVYIDDKGIYFDGSWDENFINSVLNFKPWWEKGG